MKGKECAETRTGAWGHCCIHLWAIGQGSKMSFYAVQPLSRVFFLKKKKKETIFSLTFHSAAGIKNKEAVLIFP